MSLAIIAGSGLGGLAAAVEVESETPFAEIPGVGAATIAGHAGRVVAGRLNGRACQLILGRRHFYEGDTGPIHSLIEYIADRGATTLLVTSAVGALRRELRTGELVVIHDIIDAQNREQCSARSGWRRTETRANPRSGSGPGWPATGPASARATTGPVASLPATGPASARANGGSLHIDPTATRLFEHAATDARVAWQRGTMFCASGPLYETPAEVAFQQHAGADVAAMSGAPEVAVANRLGLPVVSVAVVTNPCTGVDCAVPAHHDVLVASARAASDLARVAKQFIVKL